MQCSSRERVLLADNNAHPNPASSLQNEVLGIGLNGKGWGWVDWAGFGVEQYNTTLNDSAVKYFHQSEVFGRYQGIAERLSRSFVHVLLGLSIRVNPKMFCFLLFYL